MSIGLHVAGDAFRSLCREGQRLVGRQVPAVYIDLPDTGTYRRLLQQSSIPHAVCDDALIVCGQEAVDLGASLQLPCLPLLDAGRLPELDPLARQLIVSIVESLAPESIGEDDVCGIAVADTLFGPTHTLSDLARFVERIVTLQGCRVLGVNCGQAAVLAELGRERFCGVGLHLGAEHCSVSVTWNGREIARGLHAGGMASVDRRFAEARDWSLWDAQGRRYLDTRRVAALRSEVQAITVPRNSDEQLLADLHREWIRGCLAALGAQLGGTSAFQMLPRSLPLVCAGDARLTPGTLTILREELDVAGWPFAVSHLRVADRNDYIVSRGCLIHAESESLAVARAG